MTLSNLINSSTSATQYRQPSVTGSKSVENKKAEFQVVEAVSAVEQKKHPGISLAQKGAVNLAYLMGQPQELPVSLTAEMLTELDSRDDLQSIEEARAAFKALGPLRETDAFVWVNGEVVAMLGEQGASRNHIAPYVKQADGDLKVLEDLLKEKYGDDVAIETFAPGTGPTNAEAFELFNGRSYSDFIDSEIGGRIVALNNNEMLKMERDEAEQKRRILYEQVPQTAVFKVGGSIVGSLNEQGFFDINANILEQADAKGIARESLKAFYSYDEMGNTDSDKMQAMLEDLFGGDIEVQHFSGSDMPSLGTVRQDAKAGVLPL